MALKNIIPVSTISGFKSIEIHHDDLTNLSWHVNLLVISAFRNGYFPTPGTIMQGLLINRQVNVSELAFAPMIDLRKSLDTWVSHDLKKEWCNHLVCIEGLSQIGPNIEDLKCHLKNLTGTISLLSMKGIEVNSVGMPLLGMGQQGMPIEVFLPNLLETCFEMLDKVKGLKNIYFVHNNEEVVEKIDNEINKLLNRNKDNLDLIRKSGSNNELIELCLKKLFLVRDIVEHEGKEEVEQMIRNIDNHRIRNSEFSLSARKVLEVILTDLNGLTINTKSTNDLINSLHERNVSKWMISNFHLVRTFCNSFAHRSTGTVPEIHEDSDIKIFLNSFYRVLSFYVDFHESIKNVKVKTQKLGIE